MGFFYACKEVVTHMADCLGQYQELLRDRVERNQQLLFKHSLIWLISPPSPFLMLPDSSFMKSGI